MSSSAAVAETLPSNPDVQSPLLFGIYSLELLFHCLEISVSIVNFMLVLRTSIIHPNLKYILLFQSCCFLTRGFARSYICIGKYVYLDATLEIIGPKYVYLFAVNSRNVLAHVLILERIMATLMVRKYEQLRGWHFTAGWMPIVIIVALLNVYSLQIKLTVVPTFIMSMASLLLAIIEIIIFLWLLFYNEKMYSRQFRRRTINNLSFRYQVAENIRIGKQLVPTLVLHFWTMVTSSMVWASASFQIGNLSYILAFCTSTNTIASLLIEMTTITGHPYLKRDLMELLYKVPMLKRWTRPNANRVSHQPNGPEDGQKSSRMTETSIAMRDINGRAFLTISESKEYFDMLSKFWDGKL